MSEQSDIVKCCVCKKAKDEYDVEQCEACDKYICFNCDASKHTCVTIKEGENAN